MYLQKIQEFFGGEMIGCDEEGELYQGIVWFMIVGMEESIPSPPETNIDANWVKAELLESSKFSLTVISIAELLFVTNIHRMCLVSRNCWNMSTRIQMNCLCYTNPEKSAFATMLSIIRNVPNNLLKCKRFIFPRFKFSGFKDLINVPEREIA